MTGDGREGGGVVMSTIVIPLLVMWSGIMVALWGLWSFHKGAERERQRQDGVRRAFERYRQVAAPVAQCLVQGP